MQPTTVIKTRLESSLFENKSVLHAIKQVVNQTGFKGLWRGLLPTLMRDAPFSGLYLLFYRRQVHFFNEGEHLHFHTRFLCGLSSGFLACLLTQPFDIVKTVVLLYPQKFASSTTASKDLYKTGGFRIFFTGFLLRATKRTLTAALTWAIFDELLAYNRK
ncbi:hypothetical protein M3Y97_00938000 [Aphelenchoides bicaudatus]|nr:hypothetical protein M3Y97_00938000 [Aphelenchoides bicaudatus]